MPGQDTPNLLAAGTIRPYRFVKFDTSADNKALECEAGESSIGITTGANLEFDTDNHATTTAGDDSVMLQTGRVHRVECGGTVTRGDPLTSDGDGKAVTGGGNSAYYAMESGTVGCIIKAYYTGGQTKLLAMEAFTSDDTLIAGESGKVCTNLGATGTITLTLPQTPKAGTHFEFVVMAAQQLRVEPGAGGGVYINGAKQADNKFIVADDEAESVMLVADGNGDWAALYTTGTWSVQS